MRSAALAALAVIFVAVAPASAATQGQVYRDSKNLCSLFSPREVAKEYHAKSNTAKAAARAYSNGYRRPFRDSAYRGCLAGFKSRR